MYKQVIIYEPFIYQGQFVCQGARSYLRIGALKYITVLSAYIKIWHLVLFSGNTAFLSQVT